MKVKVFSVSIILLFCFASAGYCDGHPMDAVKGPIEEGISILRDPIYKDSGKTEIQRGKIWEIIKEVFDFEIVSRSSLARYWRKFNDKQRTEFIEVFSELLKNTYLDKLQGAYQNEEVVFLDENIITKRKAVVKSKIVREKIEIPMDYSLVYRHDKWKVYDVKIEGISLVKNYRTQFQSLLSKGEKPDELILRLKERNEKLKDQRKRDSE